MLPQKFVRLANLLSVRGNIIEANLPNVVIGEICKIQKSLSDSQYVGLAQVIGFKNEHTVLSLLNDNRGLSRDNILLPTGQCFQIDVHDGMIGTVIDAMGNIKERFNENNDIQMTKSQKLSVAGEKKDFTQRRIINQKLITGVRAIDGLLTCGIGQRFGIFAAAGCGKTVLMSMIIDHSDADVYVVGLIGERTREVTEFVEQLKTSEHRSKVIVVYSTSDDSCIERCNAAQVATTIAEYFSAQGKNVLLFIDSMTRYARALRDIYLNLGEPPARRGYPASVFEALPKILERPGNYQKGSITAFYTVLIENEEEPDVIGDEVRSILDGHLYLSRKLAAKNHYPAIDILQSLSRLFQQITSKEQQLAANKFRELLSRQRDMQLIIELGEYRYGDNKENDEAFDKMEAMNDFLKQDVHDKTTLEDTLESLNDIIT